SGFWFLVSGFWFLVSGFWFLVSGFWFLVPDFWLQQNSLTERSIKGRISAGSAHLLVPLPLQVARARNDHVLPRRLRGGRLRGWNQRGKATDAGEDQVYCGCDSSGKRRVADVGRLEERRQALVRVLDQALNLLQSVRARIGLVGVVQRLQQGQIFAGFRRDVLNGQGLGDGQLLARLQACHQRRDVQRHLGQHRQVGQGHADPLGTATGDD